MTRENLPPMRTKRVLSVVAGAFALVLWAAAPALAEPQRLGSDPEPGAELHEAPERVSIEFSEPLDESSEIRILDDCKNRLDAGDTTVNLNEMSVGVAKKPSGTYLVQYLAAGLTGTATESFTFTVLHAGPHCDGGGGHGGHGDGDGDGDGKKKHEGHRRDDDGKRHEEHGRDGGGEHDRHDDDMSGSGGHSMHDGGRDGGDRHDGHDKKKKKHGHRDDGKHGNHHKGGTDDDDLPFAGPEDLVPTDIPDGGTVLIALGLASIFGALGGWVLRISGP